MPRNNIPPGIDASLDSPVTSLRALLEIEFDAVTLRLYNGWPIDETWNSQTWTAGGFDLVAYDENPSGAQRATVVLPYSDDVLGTPSVEGLTLTNQADGQPVKLYIFLPSSNEAMPLLDGRLRTTRNDQTGLFATYDLVGRINNLLKAPRQRWNAPVWNRTIKPGTFVFWQREKYRVGYG